MYLCFWAASTPVSTPHLHHHHYHYRLLLTMSLLPPPEVIYPDPNTALTALQLHAKQHGYAFTIRSSKASRAIYSCDRVGQYDSKHKDPCVHESKQRKTGSKKCGCLMKVELRLDSLSGKWILRVLEGAHNHGPSTAAVAHTAHRATALTPETRAQISGFVQSGQSISQILINLRTSDPEMPLIAKDISNIVQKIRAEELNGRTPIQWLLEVRIKTLI
jgi:hypothetical protein